MGRTLYSLPYRLIGQQLDARATPRLVEFFADGQLVKTHAFQARGRRTDWADLPEHKAGFFMRTPAWCASQAALVGPACAALIGELLAVNALFRLRQAQGVLRLGQRHGDARLEAAAGLLGWPDTFAAEYVALAQLQAVALITLDRRLAGAVQDLVTIAPVEALY